MRNRTWDFLFTKENPTLPEIPDWQWIKHFEWHGYKDMRDMVVHLDYGKPGVEKATFVDGWTVCHTL